MVGKKSLLKTKWQIGSPIFLRLYSPPFVPVVSDSLFHQYTLKIPPRLTFMKQDCPEENYVDADPDYQQDKKDGRTLGKSESHGYLILKRNS